MASKTTTIINTKFTSDVTQYNKGVDKATKDTKKLNREIVDVDGSTTVLTGSMDDLGTAFNQTTEGMIDGLTGTSGLGAAFTNVRTKAISAARGLSAFSKAMIATGLLAAVAVLGTIVAYWEDIAKFIGLSEDNLEDFIDKQAELFDKDLQLRNRRLDLLIATGATEEQIEAQRVANAKKTDEDQEKQLDTLDKLEASQRREIASLEARTSKWRGQTDAIKEAKAALEKTKEEIIDLELVQSLARANESVRIAGLDKETDAILRQKDALHELSIAVKSTFDFRKTDKGDDPLGIKDDLDGLSKLNADKVKGSKKEVDRVAAETKKIQDIKINSQATIAASAAAFAGNNQELAASIQIAQATASSIQAYLSVLADPTILAPAKPFALAAVIAAGASQVAAMANIFGKSAGGVASPSISVATTPTETASNGFLSNTSRANQSQIVLVTEDLNKVQGRIKVTEDRASLG